MYVFSASSGCFEIIWKIVNKLMDDRQIIERLNMLDAESLHWKYLAKVASSSCSAIVYTIN